MKKFALSLVLALSAVSAPVSVAAQTAPAAPAAKYTTSDTPIGDLLDNPATKAVLEKYFPAVVKSDQIDMARSMTLKGIQSYAADTITDDKLKAADVELAAIPVKK